LDNDRHDNGRPQVHNMTSGLFSILTSLRWH
jgi:hypothetical protein